LTSKVKLMQNRQRPPVNHVGENIRKNLADQPTQFFHTISGRYLLGT